MPKAAKDYVQVRVTSRFEDVKRVAEESDLSQDRVVNLCVEKSIDQVDKDLDVLKKGKKKL